MMKQRLSSWVGYPQVSILVLCGCLASPLVTQGNMVPGMIVLLGYTAVVASPLLFHVSIEKWILSLVFMLCLLDMPGGRPFYEHLAPTEILGAFLFDPIRRVTGIPIPFTFFELFSYFMVGWTFFRYGFRSSRQFQVALLVGCCVPAITWFSALLGVPRGNSLAVAYTQIRFISLMAAWCVIGFYLAKRPRDMQRGLQLILLAVLMKSLYAIAVFLFIFGGSLGKREYLIDHLSSLIMATALFYIFAHVFFKRFNLVNVVPWLMGAVVILIPYVINDRRASFIGVILALSMLPIIISRSKLRRILWPMIFSFPLLLLLAAIRMLKGGADEASSASVAGIFSHVLAHSGPIDYREIENFNLYFSVMNNPLLGLGFGRPFPIILPMPDISFAFKDYDLIPHNNLLYIWAFAGPLGMGALAVAVVTPLIACIRLIKYSPDQDTVILAFVCFTLVIGWFCFVNFDMGILDSRAQALYGLFVGAVLCAYQTLVKSLDIRKV